MRVAFRLPFFPHLSVVWSPGDAALTCAKMRSDTMCSARRWRFALFQAGEVARKTQGSEDTLSNLAAKRGRGKKRCVLCQCFPLFFFSFALPAHTKPVSVDGTHETLFGVDRLLDDAVSGTSQQTRKQKLPIKAAIHHQTTHVLKNHSNN